MGGGTAEAAGVLKMTSQKIAKLTKSTDVSQFKTVKTLQSRHLHFGKAWSESVFYYAWYLEGCNMLLAKSGRPFYSEAEIYAWGKVNGYTKFFRHSTIVETFRVTE